MSNTPKHNSIEDGETLLRAIYSPSFFDSDGTLSPSAFELVVQESGKSESGISVVRQGIDGYIDFIHKIAQRPRKDGDTFVKTVSMIAKIVRDIQLKTRKSIMIQIVQTGRYLCHAEIRLYIDNVLVKAGNRSPEYLSFLRHLVLLVQDQVKRPA